LDSWEKALVQPATENGIKTPGKIVAALEKLTIRSDCSSFYLQVL
jgi:hypothetical protein